MNIGVRSQSPDTFLAINLLRASDRPFSAHRGSEPFVFVSYAHQWRQELAEKIQDCSPFLCFVWPDGQWLVFQTFDGGLKRVSTIGGEPVTLTKTTTYGWSWIDQDSLRLSEGGSLFRINTIHYVRLREA